MKLFACASDSANVLKKASLGTALIVMAAAIIFCNPLQMIIDSQLTLRAGSVIYNIWVKPPMPVLIKVYMFNVTNLAEFTSGIDSKIKVSEVGPYVYQEVLTNNNVTFNVNGTVTFIPKREVHFLRDKSIGDPKLDYITAPNIPYMGAVAEATRMSGFAAMAMSALTTNLNSKPMLTLSVHDYLWGYDDPLVSLASKIVPTFINFKKFGILERMFMEGHNVVTMRLPSEGKITANDDVADYALQKWNGGDKIKFWAKRNENSTHCNSIRGTYDGTLFPRRINKGDTFRVYRKAFCRGLPIVYSHPGELNGIEAYYFKLHERAFDSALNDTDSACYCQQKKCLKRGLGNIQPCYYNIPLAISFPHFFNGDPSLLDPIEGLQPNESRHGSEIILQPQLGILMRVHSRFQINLMIDDVKFDRRVKKYQNTALPLIWLEIGIDDLTSELKLLLTTLFKVCPLLQAAIYVGLIVGGLTLVGLALFKYVSLPPASAKSGIIILPSAVAALETNVMGKKLKLMRQPSAVLMNMLNVTYTPLIAPQQSPLMDSEPSEEEQEQLLQKSVSTLLLDEFVS